MINSTPCEYTQAATHKTYYISAASADKGQARNSQSAPGSVLIKEQVVAPSVHPGFGQEKTAGRGVIICRRKITDIHISESHSLEKRCNQMVINKKRSRYVDLLGFFSLSLKKFQYVFFIRGQKLEHYERTNQQKTAKQKLPPTLNRCVQVKRQNTFFIRPSDTGHFSPSKRKSYRSSNDGAASAPAGGVLEGELKTNSKWKFFCKLF